MSVTVASLRIDVDTSGIDRAQAALDGLNSAGRRVADRRGGIGGMNDTLIQAAGAAQGAAAATNDMARATAAAAGTADAAVGATRRATEAANQHAFSLNNARSQMELMVLAHELLQGRFTRFAGSMMVLANATHATELLFTSAGASIGAFLVLLGGGIALTAKSTAEIEKMNTAIELTGNYAGVSRQQMQALAETLANTAHISVFAAADVVTKLVASGKIGAAAISEVALLASQYAKATGEEVDKLTPKLIKMFEDPVKGAEEYEQLTGKLTLAQIEQIRALEQLNQHEQAQALLAKDMAATLPQQEAGTWSLSAAVHALAMWWGHAVENYQKYKDQTSKGYVPGTAPPPVDPAAAAARNAALQQEAEQNKANVRVWDEVISKMSDAVKLKELLNKQDATLKFMPADSDQAEAKERALVAIDKQIMDLRRTMHGEQTKADEEAISNTEKLAQLKNRDAAQDIAFQRDMGQMTERAAIAAEAANKQEALAIQQRAEQQRASLAYLTDAERQQHADRAAQLKEEIALNAEAGKQALALYDRKQFLSSYTAIYQANEQINGSLDKQIEQTRLAGEEAGKNATEVLLIRDAHARATIAILESEAATVDELLATKNLTTAARALAQERADGLRGEIARRRELAAAQFSTGEAQISGSLDEQVQRQKEMNEELGKSAELVEKIRVERERDRIIQREATLEIAQQKLASMDLLDPELAAQADIVEALQKEIAQRKELLALQVQGNAITAQVNAVHHLDDVARTVFMDIGEYGMGAFQKIGATIKTAVLDLLYQLTVKPWVIQVGMAMGLVPGATAAFGTAVLPTALSGAVGADAAGAIGKTVNAAGLYSAVSKGFTGIGTSVAGAYDSAATMFGPGTIGATGYSSAGLFLGGAATAGAGLLGGHYLGNFVANGYGIGDHGQAVTNSGATVGAYLGAGGGPVGMAIGAIIGGIVGGLANRLFGTKVVGGGIEGQLDQNGASGNTFEDVKGGWFRRDSHNNTGALPADLAAMMGNAFADLKAQATASAQALGVSGDALKSFVNTFSLQLTGDAQKDQQTLTDFFTAVGDTIAKVLVPNIGQFAKAGESAAQTLQRLGQDFQATTAAAQAIGKTAEEAFGAAGIASADARERLIELAGGAQNLASETQAYAQNFLSQGEQLAPVAKALDEAMAALGVSGITTRKEFKDLVDSLDLTTEAGAKMFAALMALAPAFAQVHPASPADAQATQTVADATAALQQAYNEAANAIKNNISALSQYKDSLLSLKQSLTMGALSALSPKDQYAQAAARFEDILNRAKNGDVAAQGQLSQAAQDFLGASRTVNASGAAYTRDFQHVQDALDAALAANATAQDTAQAQLDALNKQVEGLVNIDNAVKSVEQAIRDLATALGEGASSPTVTGANNRAVTSLYQAVLGRAPDAGGLTFWSNLLASGLSLADLIDALMASPEYQNAHGQNPHGHHALGLSEVPFDGYRAVLHKGEVVLPAPVGGDRPAATDALRAVRVLLERLVNEVVKGRADGEEQTGAVVHATLAAADKLTASIEGAAMRRVKNTRMANAKVALT